MKKIFLFLAALSFFTGCQTESVIDNEDSSTQPFTVSFTVDDLKQGAFGDNVTRGVIDDSQNGKYLFTNNDSLGIFPTGGYQIPFVVSGISKPVAKVSLSAEGWNTKPGVQYVAYSHFRYDNKDANAVPFTYLGQRQIGNGDNSHLVDYSFIASNTTEYNNGFNFTLLEQGVIFKLVLNLPKAGTFNRVVLSSTKSDAFALEGTYDLFSSGLTRTVTNSSANVSVKLDNIKTTSSQKTVTAYIFAATQGMIPDLKAEVYSVDGHVYSSSKAINYDFPRGFQATVTYSTFTEGEAGIGYNTIAELNNALNSAAANGESVVMTSLNTSNIDADLVIPAALAKKGDASVDITFNNAPSKGSIITITDGTNEKPAKTSRSSVTLRTPAIDEFDNLPDLTILLPNSTVNLIPKDTENQSHYNIVNSTTSFSTLIVEDGMIIERLNVFGGNVIIQPGAVVKEVYDYSGGISKILGWNPSESISGEATNVVNGSWSN